MNGPRKPDFFKTWRWTIALFSLVLVGSYWALLFSSSTWGSKFRYSYLFHGSRPVIALLFITALMSLKSRRRYAALGFAICVAWLVLGRLAETLSNQAWSGKR